MQAFVIDVWEPAGQPPVGHALRGVVRHVRSGREQPFADETDLLAFVRACLDEPGASCVPDG